MLGPLPHKTNGDALWRPPAYPRPASELDPHPVHDYYGHMVVTSVALLKASLSEYLAGVKAGGEVVVTERGRPVARIVPYEPGGAELDDLVRTGRVRRSRGHLPPEFWTAAKPVDSEGRLLRALLEERETTR